MHRWLLTLIILLAMSLPIAAQTQPRDYAINNLTFSFSENEVEFTLDFEIENKGGQAQGDVSINIVALDANNRVIESEQLSPIPAGESQRVQFVLFSADFPPGSIQPLQIEVGIDQFELAGSPIAADNKAQISIPIPRNVQTPPTPESTAPITIIREPDFVIPLIDLPIQFEETGILVGDTFIPHNDLPLIAGGVIAALVLLWLLTVILRLIFRRPKQFGIWQPPYANVPFRDPNTPAGRRQGWQQVAQSGSILSACAEGQVQPVKQLLGVDGQNMSGWTITAMRMSQYDIYGRLSRTEIIADKGLVKRLNKIARKSRSQTNEKLHKAVRPIAKSLNNQFKKKINKKSAMLPIALDIRFEGSHGEVRIQFELYQCRQGLWQQIDLWEPEMTVLGSTFRESYTYTIHGQAGSEALKKYRKRLQQDLEWLLYEMLKRNHQPAAPDTVPPDTLTNMEPIQDTDRQSNIEAAVDEDTLRGLKAVGTQEK